MIEKVAIGYKTAMSKYKYELYGREAAKAFVERNIALNTSIEKVAREYDLNKNQIARICEEANKETYLHLFNSHEKTGSSEDYSKYIVFEPADF